MLQERLNEEIQAHLSEVDQLREEKETTLAEYREKMEVERGEFKRLQRLGGCCV